ncbi:uncharacterized protein si:ch211-40k21.5 [Amphiprion ocellaris]|uniref:uncharacterized protein si:ch211-40k21.5 n=1 Tax=Amphiprion ocellaris TaxID=80972 RepID=UPI000C315741|nr:uncharacterized protein si:ch211-40k21.5 [Amphiprion ocellaris]
MAKGRPRRIRSAEHKLKKTGYDQSRAKTRINIGEAFQRWRDLRELKGMKTDAEVAVFLLDSYLQTKSESRLQRSSLKRSSSTETCESVHYEYPFMMSSSNDSEQETCADPSVQSSTNGKELQKKDAACQRPKSEDEWSENKENAVAEEDEEFSTSLSVGDGRFLVDLGSSSEFIVDEECILQLFMSCRQCNGQCTVRKHVKGLKLVVYQACCFCQSRSKWTNLPDDDDKKEDGHSQINGRDTERGQNTSMSPGSNSS